MPAPPRLVPWLLPLPSRSHSRKPGASRTTASSEGETSSSPIVDHAQILLDRSVQTLVEMETVARAGPPENSGGLASCRIPAVLEMAVTISPCRRQNGREPGDSDSNLAHGSGESYLGSPEDSWRAAQARVSHLGTDRLAMASTSSGNDRSMPALADVPEESPRRDRSYGLLHGANAYLWRSLL